MWTGSRSSFEFPSTDSRFNSLVPISIPSVHEAQLTLIKSLITATTLNFFHIWSRHTRSLRKFWYRIHLSNTASVRTSADRWAVWAHLGVHGLKVKVALRPRLSVEYPC